MALPKNFVMHMVSDATTSLVVGPLESIRETEDEEWASWEEWDGVTLTMSCRTGFDQDDLVEVYSRKGQEWHLDGRIVEVSHAQQWVDGVWFGPGSVKVVFNNDKSFKWMAPEEAKQLVRPSSQPKPPQARKEFLIQKERRWFICEQQRPVYLKVSKGFLQFWDVNAMEAVESKKMPNGAAKMELPTSNVSLIGMTASKQGEWFEVNGVAGEVYRFQASSEQGAAAWVECIKQHAAYADDALQFRLFLWGAGRRRKTCVGAKSAVKSSKCSRAVEAAPEGRRGALAGEAQIYAEENLEVCKPVDFTRQSANKDVIQTKALGLEISGIENMLTKQAKRRAVAATRMCLESVEI